MHHRNETIWAAPVVVPFRRKRAGKYEHWHQHRSHSTGKDSAVTAPASASFALASVAARTAKKRVLALDHHDNSW